MLDQLLLQLPLLVTDVVVRVSPSALLLLEQNDLVFVVFRALNDLLVVI